MFVFGEIYHKDGEDLYFTVYLIIIKTFEKRILQIRTQQVIKTNILTIKKYNLNLRFKLILIIFIPLGLVEIFPKRHDERMVGIL